MSETKERVAITTIDNPWSPFDNFDQWRAFDVESGHFSCEYLARIANITDEMDEDEKNVIIEAAIDEIVEKDPLNIYIKVKEGEPIKDSLTNDSNKTVNLNKTVKRKFTIAKSRNKFDLESLSELGKN